MSHWSRFDATADRRLLKKLTDDGESALAEVYDIYAERLYDYALLFTSDVHVARGIVHDALIDASRRAPRMRDRRHLRAWLYGAVRRRGLSQPRDAWTPPPVPAGAALASLDRTHRDALCLALRHDMDGAALATTLGVSQRRARRRVARATTRAESAARRAATSPHPADQDPARADHRADQEAAVEEAARAGRRARQDAAGDEAAGEPAERQAALHHRRRPEEPRGEAASRDAGFRGRGMHQGAVPEQAAHGQAELQAAALHGRRRHEGAAGVHEPYGSPTPATEAPGEHASRSGEDAGASPVEGGEPGGRGRRDAYGARAGGGALAGGEAGAPGGVRTLADGDPLDGAYDSALGTEARGPGARAYAPEPGADPDGPEPRWQTSGQEPGADGGDAAGEAAGGRRDGASPWSAVEIARAAPAMAPPEALRDRVQHTASDPQLARYRSQIVSRGGRLIASGFPRQPDAPSQVARRYAVGGVAMVAFAAVMGVGLNMIGGSGHTPAIGGPVPSWTTAPGTARPSAPGRTPSPGASTPGAGDRKTVALPTGRSRHGENGGRHSTGPSHRGGVRSPGPHPTSGGSDPPGKARPTLPPLPGDGVLSVSPAKIGFGTSGSTASLVLTAADGPVTWTAASGSSAVSLSANHGTIAPGTSRRVKVHLARNAILQLPGKTTITLTGTGGDRTIPVTWSISLLSR